MPSNLGIYFGTKGIEIIQSKAKRIISAIQIPQEKISASDLEEKVPQDVKIVALIKDELRKQKIEAREAGLALSGKDLIIRSFELPYLPREELNSAVNFEAKKYIPFKTEDIVSDFQVKLDKKDKKNLILFFGIKKETIENYFSIMKQLGLKLSALEYSAFSLLRLARLINLKMQGVLALVEIDLEDEANFMILEDGFPLFTRDIDLSSRTESDMESMLERLKSEIQLSLDYYYHRKFSSRRIEKLLLLGLTDYKSIVDKFSQELELLTEFIDINERIDKSRKYNLSILKAYGISLANSIKLPLDLNLIFKWEKLAILKGPGVGLIKVSLKQLRPDRRVIAIGIFIIILSFMFGLYQNIPLRKQLAMIIGSRPKLLTALEDKSYDELKKIDSDYHDKLNLVNRLLSTYPYLTLELNALPQVLPEGVWLVEYNFRQGEKDRELLLKGAAYLADRDKELEAINTFFSNLKNHPEFSKTFKVIDLFSIDRGQIGKTEVTNFAISCKY